LLEKRQKETILLVKPKIQKNGGRGLGEMAGNGGKMNSTLVKKAFKGDVDRKSGESGVSETAG